VQVLRGAIVPQSGDAPRSGAGINIRHFRGSGFRVQGSGFVVQGSGFRGSGSGWRWIRRRDWPHLVNAAGVVREVGVSALREFPRKVRLPTDVSGATLID
jgi:hypothetical protein